MASLEEYAALSSHVYPGGKPLPNGWTPVLMANDQPFQSFGTTGYYGALFQKLETGELALVSRGTELTDPNDYRADWTLAHGRIPSQFEEAQTFLNFVLDAGIPRDQITLVGHSLAGSLSQMQSALENLPAVTFNAFPVKNLLLQLGLDPNGSYQITDVVDAGDLVSHTGPPIGTRVELAAHDLPFSVLYGPPVNEFLMLSSLGRYLYSAHTIDSIMAKIHTAATTPGPCPVILDLDGDGVETIGVDGATFFDHDANGFAERTGWVGRDDGLLAWDRNGDGVIDSGRELFGNHTLLASGAEAAHGFEALAAVDGNADGRIDQSDAAFSTLRVWRDENGDGLSARGELHELATLGIESIQTSYSPSAGVDANGNEHRQVGTITRSDGTTRVAADVWFSAQHVHTIPTEWVEVPEDIRSLPNAQGYGDVHDLWQAMARDGSGALKGLVEAFVAEGDPQQRSAILEQLLFSWTGTDSIDPASRGGLIDARRLTTLEKLSGEGYVDSVNGANPNVNAAPILQEAYDRLAELFYAQLMSRSHLADLDRLITYRWDDTNQQLAGDLAAVQAELSSRLATDYQAAKVELGEFARMVRGFQVEAPLGYWSFRESFASQDAELGWVMDSAGKRVSQGTDGADSMTGSPGADALHGGAGDDGLAGEAGMDALHGDAGVDILSGGDSEDLLVGGGDADQLYGGNGSDRLEGSPGADKLHGEAADDALLGGGDADELYGGDGTDILDGGSGNDLLDGGFGSDTYLFGRGTGQDGVNDRDWQIPSVDRVLVAPDIEPGEVAVSRSGDDLMLNLPGTPDGMRVYGWFLEGFGADYQVQRVEFADGSVWDVPALQQMVLEPTAGPDTLFGYGTADAIEGQDGDDTLYGRGGDDRLDGGAGADRLEGEGGADTLLGGDDADSLMGGDGDDTLDGNAGEDVLDGGFGNDTYLFGRGAGQDRVNDGDWQIPSVDRILVAPDVAPVEVDISQDGNDLLLSIDTADRMRLSGWFHEGFGSEYQVQRVEFADGTVWDVPALKQMALGPTSLTLVGSDAADTLTGSAGDDTLYGRGGDDQLDGGPGADRLFGESGNDTYVIDSANDIVGEEPGQGIDTVQSAVSQALGPDVEHLVLTGSAAVDGTGNALNNSLTGNASANMLDGGGGADSMAGGAGDDRYVVDAAGDTVSESAGHGVDTVESSITYTLGANLEGLVLTGSTAINGTGNGLGNTLTGNAAANTLDGKAGADQMAGGSGNDTYVVDAAGDTVIEAAGQGTDTARSSVTHTLGANVENLVLTGKQVTDGTGNDLGNSLTGNGAANVLTGGAGADVLTGGLGGDTYWFSPGSGQDTIVENDASTANKDTALFTDGIRPLDIILSRDRNHLVVARAGSVDAVKVQGWYNGAARQTEVIQAADGSRLLNTQVDRLIQAMAGWSASSGLSWAEGIMERPEDVQAVLAVHWQPAGAP